MGESFSVGGKGKGGWRNALLQGEGGEVVCKERGGGGGQKWCRTGVQASCYAEVQDRSMTNCTAPEPLSLAQPHCPKFTLHQPCFAPTHLPPPTHSSQHPDAPASSEIMSMKGFKGSVARICFALAKMMTTTVRSSLVERMTASANLPQLRQGVG